MESKWVFIINPVAGSGFAAEYVAAVQEKIKEYNIPADLVFTERPGHATELAAQYAKNGFRYIIGVGGDGTLNEISKSLINHDKTVMGIVPAGTGNDFIQILGFPDRFEDKHWEIFFAKNTVAMDVVSVNNLIFINGMGLGFDAEVAAQNYVDEDTIKQGSKNKYIWHILKVLFFFREKRMTVISDGHQHETDCFINTISIGRRFAGGFLLTPKAIANDGLFDVCSIKRLSLVQRLKILLKVPKGTHIEDKRVHYYQTDHIVLEFPNRVPFHVDGELNFASKFDVKVLPAAINTIYNPEGKHFFNIDS